jgi:hypothetical protein
MGRGKRDKRNRQSTPEEIRNQNAGYDAAVRGAPDAPKLDVMDTSLNPDRKLREDAFDRAMRAAQRDVRRRERSAK